MRHAALLLALAALPALAQNRVTGTVGDGQDAALPGSSVTWTPASGPSQTALTDGGGFYSITLPSGAYTVRVEAPGFESTQTTINLTRDRIANFNLLPEPLTETVTVRTVGDAATSRPGYLPESALAQGGLFTAYGSFPLREGVLASESPFPTTLNGVILTLTGPGGTFNPPIYYAGPTQVSGIVPSAAAPGIYNLTATVGGRTSAAARLVVIEARPAFFTLNQTGFGTGIFTEPDYTVVTYQNAARPGRTYVAWMANLGGVTRDGAPEVADKRATYFDYQIRIGNTVLPKEDIEFFGPSGPGYGQANFRLSPNFPAEGCAVPVQAGVQFRQGEPFRWSNVVTMPISSSATGPCSDPLGFTAADLARLAAGLTTAETTISEATLLGSPVRNLTSGRLHANRFTPEVYNPPPPLGMCSYRWEPAGFRNPETPQRPALGGAASLVIPWGQFNFSPTSNGGPYALNFSFPSAFATGPFTLTYSDGFTVAGQPFTGQLTGTYTRPAGQMREYLASRASSAFLNPDKFANPIIQDILRAASEAPQAARQAVYGDLIVSVEDNTRGNHLIRCFFDPENPGPFATHLTNSILPLVPARPNRTRIDARFFPRVRTTANHAAGPVQRSVLTFDSFTTLDDILGVR